MSLTITRTTHATPYGEVTLYRLVNPSGASVTLSTLGCAIVKLEVPDAKGRLADVVIGYDDPAAYMADGPCSGKIPGRVAGRIAGGLFSLDGVQYRLAVNNGPNALHGGPTGFQNRIWDSEELPDGSGVRFFRTSPDGEEGYPGTLDVAAIYRWTDDNVLELELQATTDAPTVLNLTNHAYFNLGGHDSGSALGHTFQVMSSRFVDTDETLIPTAILPVEGTPLDFRQPKAIGRDIHVECPQLRIGKGYDHCFPLDDYQPGVMRTAAVLSDPVSGRTLTLTTDMPAAHLYTGNYISDSPVGKGGYRYHDYDAVAIECQNFGDSPNHQDDPAFPSVVLRPGEVYDRHIRFAFTAK